ncbi:hypothetical protein B879_04231 [Cecembia lonarensis LW9]|uniref:Uncharacterized protein n=1 Tax=Cecembia lonarensis (strain CCUG 58316 / KCTC 22772 / LW9) TaxID=1225176 RepID=K1KXF2_CECL9|nr:hypothetical protein B879_04231 [Cecembia lonarensis LW9]
MQIHMFHSFGGIPPEDSVVRNGPEEVAIEIRRQHVQGRADPKFLCFGRDIGAHRDGAVKRHGRLRRLPAQLDAQSGGPSQMFPDHGREEIAGRKVGSIPRDKSIQLQ